MPLRLVDGDASPTAQAAGEYHGPWASVEISSAWGTVSVLRIDAHSGHKGGLYLHTGGDPVTIPSVSESEAVGASTEGSPIAGTITPAKDTLLDSVERWCDYLRMRNNAASSISVMRAEVRKAARGKGWTKPDDLTFASVSEWLAAQTTWGPTTVRRNLSIFKSYARWAEASGLLARDTVRLIVPPDGEGGPGARAPSLEEARAIVQRAWICEQKDRRSRRNPRSIYYSVLMLAGCRHSEPANWECEYVLLDDDPPVIIWQPSWHKNGTRVELALAPELVDLLRQWRDARGDWTGKVFPKGLGKHTFDKDRDNAGIVKVDRRGRALTAHGCRKFFVTSLHNAGVPTPLVKTLTRHAVDVHDRYYDSPAAQADALAKLEKIYVPQGFGGAVFTENGSHSAQKSSALGIDTCEKTRLTGGNPRSSMFNATTQLEKSSPAVALGLGIDTAGGAALHTLAEATGRSPSEDQPCNSGGSADNPAPSSPLSRANPSRNAVADLLEAVARVIREDCHDARS